MQQLCNAVVHGRQCIPHVSRQVLMRLLAGLAACILQRNAFAASTDEDHMEGEEVVLFFGVIDILQVRRPLVVAWPVMLYIGIGPWLRPVTAL